MQLKTIKTLGVAASVAFALAAGTAAAKSDKYELHEVCKRDMTALSNVHKCGRMLMHHTHVFGAVAEGSLKYAAIPGTIAAFGFDEEEKAKMTLIERINEGEVRRQKAIKALADVRRLCMKNQMQSSLQYDGVRDEATKVQIVADNVGDQIKCMETSLITISGAEKAADENGNDLDHSVEEGMTGKATAVLNAAKRVKYGLDYQDTEMRKSIPAGIDLGPVLVKPAPQPDPDSVFEPQ